MTEVGDGYQRPRIVRLLTRAVLASFAGSVLGSILFWLVYLLAVVPFDLGSFDIGGLGLFFTLSVIMSFGVCFIATTMIGIPLDLTLAVGEGRGAGVLNVLIGTMAGGGIMATIVGSFAPEMLLTGAL